MSSSKAPMRRFITIFALVGLIACVPGLAEAKMGDLFRGGAGSRGSRTFSAPPPTNTAPEFSRADPAHDHADARRAAARIQPWLAAAGLWPRLDGRLRGRAFGRRTVWSFDRQRLFRRHRRLLLHHRILVADRAVSRAGALRLQLVADPQPCSRRRRATPDHGRIHRRRRLWRGRRAATAETLAFTIVRRGFSGL